MKISFSTPNFDTDTILIAGIFEDKKLSFSADTLDNKTSGIITNTLKKHKKFNGKFKKTLVLHNFEEIGAHSIILVGLGKPEDLDAEKLRDLGGSLVARFQNCGEAKLSFLIKDLKEADLDAVTIGTSLAEGALLRSYRFDKYKTKMKEEDKPTLEEFEVMSADAPAIEEAFAAIEPVCEAVFTARNLVNEPANIVYPEALVNEAKTLKSLGVDIDVLDEKDMKKLGMNSLLSVGQGSARESYLIVMKYNGNPSAENKAPLAFIGKGVTFDTGGISLKPGKGMEDMKADMAGAAAVIGLMKALAGRKAKVNVIGVVGAVENMPSSTASRPGDVVTSLSGQTIEIINTDAEGRMVLADALWYTQDKYAPQFMIDLATLTGAVIVALGHHNAGVMSNDDVLAKQIFDAGQKTSETNWRLPLGDKYNKQVDSVIADVRNTSNAPGAGTITAGQFLQRFVNEKKWAHIDIAGTESVTKNTDLAPKGATGYGVRLLNQFVADCYED
ncbi:MAG: leucyl aminopeptidase [Alphaproteobacteria bacterium]